MKNITNLIIALLAILFTVTSCKKDIGLQSIFFLPSTFATEAQLTYQLIGAYNPLQTDQLYGQGLWGYLEAGADETFRTGSNASTILTEIYRIDASEANVGTFWRQCYEGIERCNVIVSVSPGVSMDSTKRNNIVGQARFLRAYYYYLLVTRFGGLDGVPLKLQLTTDMGTDFNIARTPSKSVYDYIIREMTSADSLVTPINAPQSWQSRSATTSIVSQSAVRAILTRVCLSAAGNPVNDNSKYQLALIWAQKLINSNLHTLNAAPHPLYNTTPAYARLFINNVQNDTSAVTTTSEGIWDAAFLSKSNTSGTYTGTGYLVTQNLGYLMGITNPTSANGSCTGVYRVFPRLYNLYATGDLRRDWNAAPYLFDATNNKYQYITIVVKPATQTPAYNGTPAVFSVAITPAGGIAAINVVSGGSGYIAKQTTITLSGASVATGTGLSFTIDNTGINNSIKSITVLAAGSGYVTPFDRPAAKWRREYELNVPPVRGNQTSTNFPIIRFADVLLMAAEADLQVNGGTPSATAVEYFNQVRRRAFGYSPTAKVAGFDKTTFVLQDIMDERSRELCFEGIRRQDLIRWGVMTTAMQNISTDAHANAPSSLLTSACMAADNFLTYPGKYVLLPIPSTAEIAYNSLISQNPGW